MSNETFVTLQGWMGTNVDLRRAGDTYVGHFRVACTPRRYNRRKDEWYDAPTQWYSVTAWRDLADNCARSLRTGEPVIIHGRLETSTWVTKDGEEVTSLEVEATQVGHDLNRGTTKFYRVGKEAPAPITPEGEQPRDQQPEASSETDPWTAPEESEDLEGAVA